MITEKHVFSHGVFVIEFNIDLEDQNSGVVIDNVRFQLFDNSSQRVSYSDVDESLITELEHTDINGNVTGITYFVRFADNVDKLIRWEMRYNADNDYVAPNCVQYVDGWYRMQGYAADISNFEHFILKTADLSCDCNISNSLKCNILRSFILRAAERSNSPRIEKIFNKIRNSTPAFGENYVTHSVGGCRCNG